MYLIMFPPAPQSRSIETEARKGARVDRTCGLTGFEDVILTNLWWHAQACSLAQTFITNRNPVDGRAVQRS